MDKLYEYIIHLEIIRVRNELYKNRQIIAVFSIPIGIQADLPATALIFDDFTRNHLVLLTTCIVVVNDNRVLRIRRSSFIN